MVASASIGTARETDATPMLNLIKGLYTHFIGGRRVLLDAPPDLVRENPSASDQVLCVLRSADL